MNSRPCAAGPVEMFLLPVSEAEKLPEAFCRSRFPRRMRRAETYAFAADRLRSIGAGALLAGVLGIREQDLQTGEHGKPEVPGLGMDFNLSHSGDYILLAVGPGPVGADIEKIDPGHIKVAARVLRPEELVWMQTDPVNRFFTLWTLKESVMKATGQGLSLEPQSFSVLPAISGEAVLLQGQKLFCSTSVLEDYALSVSAPAPADLTCLHILTSEQLLA